MYAVALFSPLVLHGLPHSLPGGWGAQLLFIFCSFFIYVHLTRSTIEVTRFLKTSSASRGSLFQDRRDTKLVSKIDVFVYLSHEVVHLEVSFRVRYEAF